MINEWRNKITSFIKLTNKHSVRMIMVGGGAVNFHGYQRHSADVDFWIDTSEDNFKKLILVFTEMGYEIKDFPQEVKDQMKNISVKFSPIDLNLELITRFSSSKTFEQAYKNSILAEVEGAKFLKWKVLSYEDLIDSKIKANRPKDKLDIQQLREIKKSEK